MICLSKILTLNVDLFQAPENVGGKIEPAMGQIYRLMLDTRDPYICPIALSWWPILTTKGLKSPIKNHGQIRYTE